MQLRLRGDGRTYTVNIQPPGYNTDDMYQAFIYTRGGPLWEVITVLELFNMMSFNAGDPSRC